METIQHLTTEGITAALEANMWAYWRFVGGWAGAELHDTPELLWVRTPFPDPSLNAVVRTNLPQDRSLETIVATRESHARLDLPLLWICSPSTRPADLGRLLVDQGFVHYRDEPGMALDLQSLPGALARPEGLMIERVDDVDGLRAWCGFAEQPRLRGVLFELFAARDFGEDRLLYNYVGRLEGRQVATSTLVLSDGVAGIYNVMTVPGAQRRGIGTCMTVRPLQDALARGYRIGVLLSSPMGLKVYQRLGFRPCCSMGLYLWMKRAAQKGEPLVG